METLDTLDIQEEEQRIEQGSDITLYVFDENGILEHWARIVASTPEERADGYGRVFLTLHLGGEDMRRFDEQDTDSYPGLADALEQLGEWWPNRRIWWQRDGSIPGVEDGVTFYELRGGSLLYRLRNDTMRNMRIRGIEAEGEQAETDERTLEKAGLEPRLPSLFDMFEEYVIAAIERLRDAGETEETIHAWERQSYRMLMRSTTPRHADENTGNKG